jgi:AraC-like DNA-binding protein
MKWITRERPKIDRIACPWLIKRFVDTDAQFIYLPFDEVLAKAKILKAIPFDIPNVEFTHYGQQCILIIADIVRGADTDRHDIANEAAGLWAISAGLAHNITDDYQLLEKGMMLYDALYSWAKYLYKQKHLQNNPFENLLHEVYTKILQDTPKQKRKSPQWVKELKEIIQDQVDTNFTFSLKEFSSELDVHPSYISREFSKYFDNLSFGDYIRKIRIDKAIELIQASKYSLTEIAYLTGFSDQSHFTRIFKKHTGKNPSSFKKNVQKGKQDTKGQ